MILEKRRKLEWTLDALSLGAVLQYAAYRFLQSTMFVFYYSNTYKMITMLLLIVFGGVRWLYLATKKWKERDEQGRKRFLLYCLGAVILALPFFYVGWKHDYKFLIFLPICCMCLYDMETEKILKAFAWTIGTLLAATVLCCLSGTVRNLVHQHGNDLWGSYGCINTSDFASYFTFLLLIIWCGMQVHRWHDSLIFSAFTGMVSYFVFKLTDSRTVLICGLLTVLFIIWDCIEEQILRKRDSSIGKRVNRFSLAVFPLIGLIVLLLTMGYSAGVPWVIKLDEGALSGRLSAAWNPYQIYGIHPFGSVIESMHGKGGTVFENAWSSGYGYIDVAYAMLSIRYGWIITIIVTCLWVATTARALQAGNNRIALAMAILAVHALSEARILDLNYNVFLIMPLVAFNNPKDDEQNKSLVMNEKRHSFSLILGLIIFCGILTVLPRLLSWMRTFFSLLRWNVGEATFGSLVVIMAFILLIIVIWKTIGLLYIRRSKREMALLLGVVVMMIGGIIGVNKMIDSGYAAQKIRLGTEERTIQLVQEVATLPVYAAEPEELYRRSIGGFSDHTFSTEELYRLPRGTIFTDQDVEVFNITPRGQYTQISDWTGLYTFDAAVIDALSEKGYTWTSYYNGKRSCNLSETAKFNGLICKGDQLLLKAQQRIITKNMETDQYSGIYEVIFSFSGLSAPYEGEILVLEVLGDGGEKVVYQEVLTTEDFDSEGKCVHKLIYQTDDVPKVSFAITAQNECTVVVDEIDWQRIM